MTTQTLRTIASAAALQHAAVLAATSDAGLLDHIVAMTHAIDRADPVTAGELRGQRDAVRAECIRRMGAGR